MRTAILTLLLLWPAALLAQPAATEPEEDVAAAADEPADANTPAPAENSDESPYDYEASEQISEDLSVSFPVDI